MEKDKKPMPGDGIRSLRSSMMFRAINFELYAKPNKVIMLIGGMVMLSCTGYLIYMKNTYEAAEYYTAVAADGEMSIKRKKSKWLD